MRILFLFAFAALVAACFKIPPQVPLRPLSWDVTNCNLIWTGKPTGETRRECYTESNWREATPLSECSRGEKSGALCYPPCREGYEGNGPVCWKKCPEGYHDDGVTCRRDAKIISANTDACPWWNKCGLNSSCSTCPEGYKNDGCTCRRDVDIFGQDAYGRGVGWPMSCADGKEQIAALCYGECPAGSHENGIWCDQDQQTCKDIPVNEPADYSAFREFCFKMSRPTECFTLSLRADEAEHAKELAQCQCTNCEVTPIDCSAHYADTACR